MSGSFRVYKHTVIERKLSERELQGLCGALVHNIAFDQSLKPWQFVKPIPEKRFKRNAIPHSPIIKLGEKKHVEDFFNTGALQLGSFNYYNAYDHPEIGDSSEGIVTLVAKTPFGVIGGKYGCGFNQRMFCTSIGDVDQIIMDRLGYNSGFVITDPRGFSEAIAASIGASSYSFGQCLYHQHKAILGFPGSDVSSYELSHRTLQIVNAGKHFIKKERYSYQKEFRFLWDLPSDVTGAMIYDCSSARQYCSPLTGNLR